MTRTDRSPATLKRVIVENMEQARAFRAQAARYRRLGQAHNAQVCDKWAEEFTKRAVNIAVNLTWRDAFDE